MGTFYWHILYVHYIIHAYLFVCLRVHLGVGGIEAEAVMLGQSISMVLPKVVGYKLTGNINPLSTSTDVVLTITKVLLYMHTYHVHVCYDNVHVYVHVSICTRIF